MTTQQQQQQPKDDASRKAERTTALIKRVEANIEAVERDFRGIVESAAVPVTFERECLFAKQLLHESATAPKEAKQYLFKIATANPTSLRDALLDCAATGLTLNPSLKLAYLMPRDRKIIFEPSYQGIIAVATDAGAIRSARAAAVYEHDEFDYYESGAGPYLHHKRAPLNTERGELIGAYCITTLPNGDVQVKLLDRNDIEKRRKAGGDRDFSPYSNWYEEMAIAKVVRAASKTWPRKLDSKRMEALASIGAREDAPRVGPDDARNVTPGVDAEDDVPEVEVVEDEPRYITQETADELGKALEQVHANFEKLCAYFQIGCIEELPLEREQELRDMIAEKAAHQATKAAKAL